MGGVTEVSLINGHINTSCSNSSIRCYINIGKYRSILPIPIKHVEVTVVHFLYSKGFWFRQEGFCSLKTTFESPFITRAPFSLRIDVTMSDPLTHSKECAR